MVKSYSRLLAVCLAAVITTTSGGCKIMCEKETPAAALSGKVYDILQKPSPENWQPSGLNRTVYLDMIERIVRIAAPWVNEHGAVIDPVLNYEHGQTSPRFASTCAVAIYFGRCTDLKEKLYRVMDHCCYALTQTDAVKRSSNFWMRELITAYNCLKNIAPAERVAQWKKLLSQVEPEKVYKYVSDEPEVLTKFHNWVVYSSAGESMRQSAGIGFNFSNSLFKSKFENTFTLNIAPIVLLITLGLYSSAQPVESNKLFIPAQSKVLIIVPKFPGS